jgi:hypothetical protein
MEKDRYLNLINQELKQLPSFITEYKIGTNLSTTTVYQYLTEFRRFFDWLRSCDLSTAITNEQIAPTDLEHLKRNDIMMYLDYIQHTSTTSKKA